MRFWQKPWKLTSQNLRSRSPARTSVGANPPVARSYRHEAFDRLREWGGSVHALFVTTDLDTLITALYVKIGDVAPEREMLRAGRMGLISHSRYFWGLRLYLVCTPTGKPMLWALANAKLGEREVLAAMLEVDAELVAEREVILLISDKGFGSGPFERELAGQRIELLGPSRKREEQCLGEPALKKVRQLIESVNDTLEGQLDLEEHGGQSVEGVAIRVAQRVLAMAAAIWHNYKTGRPVTRSLIAYDH
jgi:hypothetical protein